MNTNQHNVEQHRRAQTRRTEVAALRRAGIYAQADLARRLGVGERTIRRDLVALDAQWAEAAAQDHAAEKQLQQERCEDLLAVLWPRALSATGADQTFAVRAIVVLMERQARLRGYDEPEKRELSGVDGGPIEFSLDIGDARPIA